MTPEQLVNLFREQTGGECAVTPSELQQRLRPIKAFVFDWDGVFNNGTKNSDTGSSFSEIDSMGTNLLRFGYWLKHGAVPFTAIITGEQNHSAIHLGQREHFDAIYFKTKNKSKALEHIKQQFNVEAKQIAYFFDDILDLSATKLCGLRLMIKRQASVLFNHYTKQQQCCDYISGQQGGQHAVREICELLLGLMGQFENATEKRIDYEPHYRDYIETRNNKTLQQFVYSLSSDSITAM